MSADAARDAPGSPASETGSAPSEEELRQAYEEELARITSTDLMLQAAVSLLNLGGRRLGAPEGAVQDAVPAAGTRDMEQVRDAIEGVRALLGVLERRLSNELGPLRDALSQLQLAYAREAKAAAAGPPDESKGAAGGQGQAPKPGEQQDDPDAQPSSPGPGPAEASGRLWLPGR